ncbi:hypothetical protein D3C76_868510 [compost metagenome]
MQQAGLGRTDEQQAVLAGQPADELHRPRLGGAVEIDQQVAAEHVVVGRLAGEEGRFQQVPAAEAHLVAHRGGNPVVLPAAGEVALAKAELFAAERVAPVEPGFGALQQRRADVQRVDMEGSGGQAGVEQRHDQGIGFLTAGTGHAEQAQRPRALQLGGAARGMAGEHGEGFRIAEEPGLRHHHRVDQRLLLVFRGLQEFPVGLDVAAAHPRAAQAYGAGDQRAADGFRVETDPLPEQAGKAIAHDASPSACGGNSMALTLSGSRSSTRISCSSPSSSSSTGPR